MTQLTTLSQAKDLKVGVYTGRPFAYYEDNQVTGISVDVWEKIAKKEKISYQYYNVDNNISKLIAQLANKELDLIGNDWNFYSFNSLPSNYNIKKNNNIYKGNICLDLGCIEGSSSLYSRSNQIIESGGLIIQSFQSDGKKIWGDLHDKILFNNLPDLINLLEKLLNDKNYCSILLQEIYKNFADSNKSIEKSLDKVFNIPN